MLPNSSFYSEEAVKQKISKKIFQMTSRHPSVLSVIAPSSVLRSGQEGFIHSVTVTKKLCLGPSVRTMTRHPCTHTSEKVMGLRLSRRTITTLLFPLMHVLRCAFLCTFGLLSVWDLACSYQDELGELKLHAAVDLALSDGERERVQTN